VECGSSVGEFAAPVGVGVRGAVVEQHARHHGARPQPAQHRHRVVEQNHRQPDQKSSFRSVRHTEMENYNQS